VDHQRELDAVSLPTVTSASRGIRVLRATGADIPDWVIFAKEATDLSAREHLPNGGSGGPKVCLAYPHPTSVIRAKRLLALPEERPFARPLANIGQDVAFEQYGLAQALRKRDLHSQAIIHYTSALHYFLATNDRPSIVKAFNGLGLSYYSLAAAQLIGQYGLSVIEAETGILAHSDPDVLLYQAIRSALLDPAHKGWSCHILALAVVALDLDLLGQARQVSNLGHVETLLGNLDTAKRYQTWALRVHEQCGDESAVSIDRQQLLRVDSLLLGESDGGIDEGV
jgi:tetratricopeptide (TPR) repeat protein